MFGNPKNFYVISVKASILTSLVSVNMIKFETSKIELFMKKALFCFFLLISGMTLSAQDVKTQPTTPELIKFSETSYDFGKIPQGFLVISLDSGIVVFKPASPEWSSSRIYLQATAAGNALIYVV
jgi:hypothetical protein